MGSTIPRQVFNQSAAPRQRSLKPATSRKLCQAPIWWARNPWQGKFGSYVCVANRRGELFVGVESTKRGFYWLDAKLAMTEVEAECWVRSQR